MKYDSTIDQLAYTICHCVQEQAPDDAVHNHVEEIVKAAESRAANFLRENTGDEWGPAKANKTDLHPADRGGANHSHLDEWGPAKARYDDIRAAAWILNRMLDEFPVRPLHDPSFTVDPETPEDLCRASATLSAANTLIAKVSKREGSRGGDAQ